MKKFITSFLTFALIICCFTFVGCKDKENNSKPATIEATLEILDQFVIDMQAVEDKILADGYTYPTNNAIADSVPVRSTDKSSIDIQYSNYIDFDYDYDFEQGTLPEPYSPAYNFYPDATSMWTSIKSTFIGIYKNYNLKLNSVYEKSENVYIKLTNDNTKITFTIISNELDEEFNVEIIIYLDNDSNWKSVEYKHYEIDGYRSYVYIEKSTNNNRIFNRYISIEEDNQGVDLVDLNETTQKMIYIDKFETDSMNIIESKVYNYLESLEIESFIDNINIENAVEIQDNLG